MQKLFKIVKLHDQTDAKTCKLTGWCHRKWFLCNVVTVVNLISNTFKLLQVYQGLTVGHLVAQKTNPAPCGMVYDPRTKCLVTNGKPGHLQFYNVETDKQLYNVSYYFFGQYERKKNLCGFNCVRVIFRGISELFHKSDCREELLLWPLPQHWHPLQQVKC